MKYLLGYKLFESKSESEQKKELLLWSVRHGNIIGINSVIDDIDDINFVDNNGTNLVLGTIYSEKIEEEEKITIIQKLLDKGVDINYISNGRTALTACNSFILFKFLVDNGADIDPDDEKLSPLYDKSGFLQQYWEESNKICEYLIKKGVNVNVNPYGETPLFKAVQKENVFLVKMLLENGADPNIEIRRDLILLSNNNIEIVKMLLDKGANIISYILPRIFHFSDTNDKHLEVSKMLLNKGADPFATYKDKTIFEINKRNSLAKFYKSYEFQKWLLDKYDIEAIPYLEKKGTINKLIRKEYKELFDTYHSGNKFNL